MSLRIGTRGSALARTQTNTMAVALQERGHDVTIEVIKTVGDKDVVSPFAQVGAAGIFVRELEEAILDGRVDLAVHSFKDLPSQSPSGLTIGAIPPREDPSDALLIQESSFDGTSFIPLQQGAKVGTASARRTAWLHHLRPDLEVVMIRGNVPTRANKVIEKELDAVMLASAGVRRLAAGEGPNLTAEPNTVWASLDPQRFIPAPSQGALALQCREDDATTLSAISALNDPATQRAVDGERQLLALVQGGCELPFGAFGYQVDGVDHLTAMLVTEKGIRHASRNGTEPSSMVAQVWDELNA